MASFLISLWVIRSIFALSEATYYWQLKEYRWDRMKEFLFQQKGRQHFINTFHLFSLVGVLAYAITWFFAPSFWPKIEEWFPLFAGVLFLSESLQYLHHLVLRKLKRPRLTLKALLILGSSFGFELLILAAFWWVSAGLSDHFLSLILVLLALVEFDINAFFIGVLNYISRFAKRNIFKKAQKKRLERRDLIVIGITGSYGKTSVKEYLSHILSKKYKVLKTEKNTNTEIGIAQTILQNLTPEHEVFVCEMGAYSKGEIKLCAQIAVPKIGVFTGLNNQHAALFGSLDDTFKSKWELIQSLPADGLAVLNGDSDELRKRIVPPSARMIICSTSHGDAIAENIHITSDKVSFTYQGQPFHASLSGSFQVVNLLMSIVLSEYLGMKLPDIAEQVRTLKPPEKTMVPTEFARGILIDDSYNVNSDGLQQALLHLDQFVGFKKVVIFPGILELGEEAARQHEQFGEWIGHHSDYAFFTDPSFSPELSQGALEGGITRRDIFEIQDQEDIQKAVMELLSQHPNEKFVFLFESRGAERVMEWLKAGAR